MQKTLSFLLVLFALVSCGKSGGSSSANAASIQGDIVNVEELSLKGLVPQAALNWDVNLKFDNFNTEQEDKVREAAELIKRVVASEEFKNGILNFKYKGKKTFANNGGLSNAQIYKKIIEGSEKLMPGIDNQMDLDLEVYYEDTITVGYTFPNVNKIWMNSKFLNRNSPAKVTTNMMHEWLHKLGFEHDVDATSSRPYSVPYAVGYLVARLAARMN